jgi:hypothetical protein
MTVTFISDPEYASRNTISEIISRMLVSLPSSYDRTEGSFAYDLIATFAAELETFYQSMDQVATQVYPQTATDVYLEAIAESFGVSRKLAAYATLDVDFTGTIGTVVPAGTRVSTLLDSANLGEPIYFQTLNETTLSDTTATIATQCTTGGVVGNVAANAVVRLEDPIDGITSINNSVPATGGSDEQSDDDLRTVLLERMRLGRGAGTTADYEAAGTSVAGVGVIVVEPLWAGNGTVRVIVMDAGYAPVSSAVLAQATAAIAAVTPVGADVTVTTPSLAGLDFVAQISLESGYGIADVQTECELNVAGYLKTVSPGGVVYLSEVLAVIVQTHGVKDVTWASLTIEGTNTNYQLASNTKGYFGSIILSTP